MYNTQPIERMPFLEIFIGYDPLQIPMNSKVANLGKLQCPQPEVQWSYSIHFLYHSRSTGKLPFSNECQRLDVP